MASDVIERSIYRNRRRGSYYYSIYMSTDDSIEEISVEAILGLLLYVKGLRFLDVILRMSAKIQISIVRDNHLQIEYCKHLIFCDLMRPTDFVLSWRNVSALLVWN